MIRVHRYWQGDVCHQCRGWGVTGLTSDELQLAEDLALAGQQLVLRDPKVIERVRPCRWCKGSGRGRQKGGRRGR